MENVTYTKEERVAIILIDRPGAMNVINKATLEELKFAFADVESDPDIACVIFSGTGEKALSPGGDIKEELALDVLSAYEFSKQGQMLGRFIEKLRVPVIAAMYGHCIGGVLDLSLCCDLRIGADTAKFSTPSAKLGSINAWGISSRLSRVVGLGAAKRMMMFCDGISAEEALRLKLIDVLVSKEDLMETAKAYARRVMELGPIPVRNLKALLNFADRMGIDEALELERLFFCQGCGTEDAKEGFSAFLEKRPPVFKNK